MQLYLPGPHTSWQKRQSGEVVNYAEGRDYPYRRTLFKLPELGDEPLTFICAATTRQATRFRSRSGNWTT